MGKCDELKRFLLENLAKDIEDHERGLYWEIGKAADRLPDWKACEAEGNEEWKRLLIAVDFWDMWQDARNHGWAYYPGVEQKDWPIIARQICQGINERWELSRMTDNLVFQPPPPKRTTPLWQRIKSVIKGRM